MTPPKWRLLAAIFAFSIFAEGVFFSHLVAFLPLYLPTLGVPHADVPRLSGWITAASSLAGIPLLPFWGALADRFRRKPVIVRSYAIFLLAGVWMIFADGLTSFVIGRCLVSLAQGNTGLMMASLAEHTPIKRVGFAMTVANAAAPVAVCIGPAVGGALYGTLDLRGLLALDCVFLAVASALLVGVYEDRFTGTKEGSLLKMAAATFSAAWDARIRLILIAFSLLYAGWIGAYTYVPVVIGERVPEDEVALVVGGVLAVGGIATLALAPLLGVLGDRYGHFRVLVKIGWALLVLFPLPVLSRSVTQFALGWALVTGLACGAFALSFVVLQQVARADVRGRVMTFSFLPVVVGAILGPGLVAMLVDSYVDVAFPLASITTAAALGVLAQWSHAETMETSVMGGSARDRRIKIRVG